MFSEIPPEKSIKNILHLVLCGINAWGKSGENRMRTFWERCLLEKVDVSNWWFSSNNEEVLRLRKLNPTKRIGADLEIRTSDSLPRLLFRPTTIKIKGIVNIIKICFRISENTEPKDHEIRGFAHFTHFEKWISRNLWERQPPFLRNCWSDNIHNSSECISMFHKHLAEILLLSLS